MNYWSNNITNNYRNSIFRLCFTLRSDIFWGSTVITNLLSSIPYLGNYLVQWIWGGFSINNPTLTRFFCLHFILPFLIAFLTIIHLFFLHITGSRNPLGLNRNLKKISFNPFFSLKDLIGFLSLFLIIIFIISFKPYLLGDRDNFILANPLVTPEHIQPEWYFLFAYAILRSIPRKLGGVIALIISIIILFFFTFIKFKKNKKKSILPMKKIDFLNTNFYNYFINLNWNTSCRIPLHHFRTNFINNLLYYLFY